jgi:hypothetical protein
MFRALLDCFRGKNKKPETIRIPYSKSKKLPNMVSISPYFEEEAYFGSTVDTESESIDIDNTVVVVVEDDPENPKEYVVLGHLHQYDSYYAVAINKEECPAKGESIKVTEVEDFAVFQIIDGIGEVDFFYYLVKNSVLSKELFQTFFEYNQGGEQE